MPPHLRHDISTTDTQDGMVLLDEISGRYWQLNQAGAHVLHALLDGNEPSAIAADLAGSYGLAPDQARRDVDAVITRLNTEKLLTIL